MAIHEGRVVATDQRNYALRRCDGTLAVERDRLVVQAEVHANGPARKPVVVTRSQVVGLRLRCGLFGATLTWENRSGYRNPVVRARHAAALLADLEQQAWPVAVTGWRRPR